MDLNLSGRRALVTGASTGLGKSTALALAQEGAEVAIASRSQEKLAAAKSEIISLVPSAVVHIIPADVTSNEAVASMAATAEDVMGGVDILIANAGGPPPATLHRPASARIRRSIAVEPGVDCCDVLSARSGNAATQVGSCRSDYVTVSARTDRHAHFVEYRKSWSDRILEDTRS